MDQSFHARPFRFNTEFAANAPRPGAPVSEGSLEVAALRAEMEALRADHAQAMTGARSEAFLEGLAQARAEREQALLAALDALQTEWEEFADAREAMMEVLRGEATHLAHAIGEALAAHALDACPVQAIDDAIGRILSEIARGQEVLIAVHPDLVTDTETRIAWRQSQDRRQLNLTVQADETLQPGDACLRWEDGGLHLDAAARAASIMAQLQALNALNQS